MFIIGATYPSYICVKSQIPLLHTGFPLLTVSVSNWPFCCGPYPPWVPVQQFSPWWPRARQMPSHIPLQPASVPWNVNAAEIKKKVRISLHIWNEQCNSDSGQVLTLYLYCFTHHDYRICHLTAISNMPIYHPVEHQLLPNSRIGSESTSQITRCSKRTVITGKLHWLLKWNLISLITK